MQTVIAQIAVDWWAPITQLGVAGAMLYWLTVRVESRMKGMETSVDRMAKASLLQILSYEKNHNTFLKDQASVMLEEINRKHESPT